MPENQKLEVVIGGEIITLKSGENEDYLQRLARYTDRKINEIKSTKSNATIHERTRSVFIAINIADDYLKEKDKTVELEAKLEKYTDNIAEMEDENRLLKDSILDLQGQLERAKRELDEYIANFDNATNVVTLKNVAGGFR